jgi:PTS system mannose-specific IIA component
MVGVVVVTHGDLGAALVRSASGLVGALSGVTAVACSSGQPAAEVRRAIHAAADSVDAGGGVLFLVDLAGSTPCNACVAECAARSGDLLCGVNLPMLLKLASSDRGAGPAALATELERTARRSIRRGGELGKS